MESTSTAKNSFRSVKYIFISHNDSFNSENLWRSRKIHSGLDQSSKAQCHCKILKNLYIITGIHKWFARCFGTSLSRTSKRFKQPRSLHQKCADTKPRRQWERLYSEIYAEPVGGCTGQRSSAYDYRTNPDQQSLHANHRQWDHTNFQTSINCLWETWKHQDWGHFRLCAEDEFDITSWPGLL